MQDLLARWEKLLADAAGCEMISNLVFSRLASQCITMAEATREELQHRKSSPPDE